VRMSTFQKHKADIARAVEAKEDIRILAPIPGTDLVGVEVTNETRTVISLGKEHFTPNTLMLPIGADIHGKVVKVSLAEMPHLLIAGTTGSGKSILLRSIITALTKQMTPESMHLVLVDPKRVELTHFKKSKHLHGAKILYEYKDVAVKLAELCAEMDRRYELLEKHSFRDIQEYNADQITAAPKYQKPMPYIITVIDEYADFMIRAKTTKSKVKTEDEMPSVELLLTRLAQMARAVGIHLIIATQRPSVDVITGLIKANFPTRVALTTASLTESQIILGEPGAEKLSGKGDMLFVHPGVGGKVRLQGFYLEK
jgi:S-DNA-T family DNA segregation ATPase FtsK/SpoIIIE